MLKLNNGFSEELNEALKGKNRGGQAQKKLWSLPEIRHFFASRKEYLWPSKWVEYECNNLCSTKKSIQTYNIKSFGQRLKSTFITKVNCEIRKGDEIKIICSRFLKISHAGGKEN